MEKVRILSRLLGMMCQRSMWERTPYGCSLLVVDWLGSFVSSSSSSSLAASSGSSLCPCQSLLLGVIPLVSSASVPTVPVFGEYDFDGNPSKADPAVSASDQPSMQPIVWLTTVDATAHSYLDPDRLLRPSPARALTWLEKERSQIIQ